MKPYLTDTRYEGWLTEICEAFDLDGRASFSPLLGGTANVSFVLDAEERVIVTFCVGLSVQRAERLAGLLEHLGLHGFATNRLLRSKSGDRVHVVSGVPTIVKSFIVGDPVGAVDEAIASRIGAVLGRLHKVPAPPDPAPDHAMDIESMQRVVDGARDSTFTAWVAAALRTLPKDWGELPEGVVHGDLIPDNLIECPDGSLIPIDFEEACLHPLVFDVGMSLFGLAHVHSLTPQTAASLLAGYEAERVLSPSERELIPTMVEYSSAMTACWRFDLGQREGPPAGELRDWREARPPHAQSVEWRRSGIWSTLLGS